MQRVVLALLAVVLAVVAACVPLPGFGPEADPEQEYYRGIYDVCYVQTGGNVSGCLRAVARARGYDWYGQPSEGWEWPVGELEIQIETPTPSPLPGLPPAGEGEQEG